MNNIGVLFQFVEFMLEFQTQVAKGLRPLVFHSFCGCVRCGRGDHRTLAFGWFGWFGWFGRVGRVGRVGRFRRHLGQGVQEQRHT